ncbi:DUF3105 domain-containing protein [Actinomycetospora soli]|uniref:DUF3105 domain-containing protein n=1 Tax=Actinomycetospora soli TaxID=2893887 RepID=UPI001E63644E|nr:DUF3105 domain-containing protein [Actinomycetospora soli]MCD2189224.1 DUF3105 domain-containing protein [Actinomycetospora soli]
MASGRSTGTPQRGKGGRPPQRGKNPVAGARKRTSSAGRGAPKARQVPWLLIGAVVVVLALIGGIGFFLFDRSSQISPWRPSDSNRDPSLAIPGIVTQAYEGSHHVTPQQRVAYDRFPAFGGPHDGYWAACNGQIYPQAVRTENMVHSLEHGAVWIAYDPARVTGAARDALAARVQGQNQMVMSPFPGLDQPISLQSWGHQLKVSDPTDPRIDQFITSLKGNPYGVYPEVGASCDALGPGYFDPANPPAFDPPPYPRDALPMDYQGTSGAGGMGGAG